MICEKKKVDIGAGPMRPREVESSIGIRKVSYSTLVVVISSRSLYSKFFFLNTRAIYIGMKFLSPW